MKKPTHVGLWLDKIGDPGNPGWIVSLDRRDDRDGIEWSDTESIFPEAEYAAANAKAFELGHERGLPVIETDEHGTLETIFRPPTDDELADEVRAKARTLAAAFVEEFHEPLDPTSTDWDGAAWADVPHELSLTEDQAERLWPVFQEELVAETERLCDD